LNLLAELGTIRVAADAVRQARHVIEKARHPLDLPRDLRDRSHRTSSKRSFDPFKRELMDFSILVEAVVSLFYDMEEVIRFTPAILHDPLSLGESFRLSCDIATETSDIWSTGFALWETISEQ
jgi:hypothetical protein